MEPIVPLRGLAELGYTITWSRAGCAVKHPRLGKIKCWERSGCPVVRRDHALALITEIERMDTEKRNDRRFTREEANKVSTKISRFKKEPADEPAGGSPVSVQKFQPFVFQKFRTRRSRLGGGTCKRRWKSKLGGVHRQKNQPGTSTKLGRRISKCGSETRSTNARFKGKIHEGIARLEEHQPEEGEHGRNEGLRGKNLWPICCQRSSL